MRRDTVFSHFVHFVGTDLHFDGVTVPLKLDKHRRMQRLVQVGLGDGDVVLEAAGHRLPLCVNCAQHGVAVLYRIDNHAHRRQVVYLVQRFVLFLHLAVNAVQVLDATVNIKVFYACFGKFDAHLPDKVVYYFVTFLLFEGDTFGNTEVCVGIEILKAQVFQLALDLRHTESACNRREDFQSFLCRALLLFGNHVLQTAHVVQAVRQFDKHNADVLCHCKKHLAHIFRLFLFLVVEGDFFQFGYARDKVGNFVAETLT